MARSGQTIWLSGGIGTLRIFLGTPPRGTAGRPVAPQRFAAELRAWIAGGVGANHAVWVDIYEWLGTPLPKPPLRRDLTRMADELVAAFENSRLCALRSETGDGGPREAFGPNTIRDATPPGPHEPGEDPDFIRILLFDSTGAPVPSDLDPLDVTVDIQVGGGGPVFRGLPLVGGMADVAAIDPGNPSQCTVRFVGVAASAEPVPREAPPAAPVVDVSALVRGSLEGPRLVTRRELALVQAATLRATTVFQLRRRDVDAVELEHFPEGGAVLWPGAVPNDLPLASSAAQVRGIDTLRACISYGEGYDPRQILVTGHGRHSQERADGIKALLAGDAPARRKWVSLAQKHADVADQQAILKWVATEFGWWCDPGEVDGELGPLTRSALRGFQESFNVDRAAGLLPFAPVSEPIWVDGIVGPQTFGAMYDCYQRALGDPAARQANFTTNDLRAVGCGSHHTETPFKAHPQRRSERRRVEVLLFDDGEQPAAVCTAHSASPCNAATCELYDPREYTFEYLPVTRHRAVAPFRLSLTVGGDTPWTTNDKLVIVDSSGTTVFERRLGEGVLVGPRRIFTFADYEASKQYRGEIRFGESRFVLFGPSDVGSVQDPDSATVAVADVSVLDGEEPGSKS